MRKPRSTDGRIYRNGYVYLKSPDHPRCGKMGLMAEHRLVIEESIGRILERIEVVHHINHDKTDNRLENLQLFSSPGEHIVKGHPELIERYRNEFKGKHHSPDTEFKKGLTPWNKGL